MFESLETGAGLDLVIALQDMANPLFDALAELLNAVGLTAGWLVILPIFFWSINKPLGKRLLFALVVAVIANTILKEAFNAPRPYHVSEDVIAMWEAEGNGFPSGHVMGAFVVWGVLATWYQSWLSWGMFAVYVLLMGWSRIYGGVHYPQDVVGSLLISPIILYLFLRGYAAVEKQDRQLAPIIQVISAWVIGILLAIFLWESETGVAIAGTVLGLGLGIPLEANLVKFHTAGSVMQRVLRYVMGMILIAIIYLGLKVIFDSLEPAALFRLIRYTILSFFAVVGWAWIGMQIGLFPPSAPDVTREAAG